MIYGEAEDEFPDNQAQISLGCLTGICIYAVSDRGFVQYSVMEAVMFFALLFIGFRCGAAASAVTGFFAGIVLAYLQNDPAMIGLSVFSELWPAYSGKRKGGLHFLSDDLFRTDRLYEHAI